MASIDSRFFRAHTARRVCEAGRFVLMGRPLRALSCLQLTLLEEVNAGVLYLPWSEIDLADLEVFSLVCSEREPEGDFSGLEVERLKGFDLEKEKAVLEGYLALCWHSIPRTNMLINGGPSAVMRSRHLLFVVTALLRECHGMSRAELWMDLPMVEVLWQYEAMREQRDRASWLAETDEPVEASAEEVKHSADVQSHAERIFAWAVGKASAAKTEEEALAIEGEKFRLLSLVADGDFVGVEEALSTSNVQRSTSNVQGEGTQATEGGC